jgi:ammonium transporter Rh
MSSQPTAQENAMISYRRMTAGALLFSQVVLVILYAVLTEYGDGPSATTTKSNGEHSSVYPYYQDVHVMIFIGFGFLMTFLKKYGFSSVGYNFLISCLAIQWAMVSNGLLHYVAGHSDGFSKIQLGIVDLVRADFAAAAVMITFGAVLGKTSPLQMLLITFFELIFYGVNEAIGAGRFTAVDMGGSIFVHTFGAFFGLGLSWVISRAKVDKSSGEVIDNFKNGSTKTSDMFAMVGTIFLWMFWVKKNDLLFNV